MHSLVQALRPPTKPWAPPLIAVLSSSGALPDQFSSGTFYALSCAMAGCLLAHIWASRRYVYTSFFHVDKPSSLSLELLPDGRASAGQGNLAATAVPFTEQSNDITSEIDIVANACKPALIHHVDQQLFAGFKHHDGIFSAAILAETDRCVSAIDARLRAASSTNGKILFLFSGCGTSGRYAFQCARAFQEAVSKRAAPAASCTAFDFTIAGGYSIVASQELPEDDPSAGQRDMDAAVARHSPSHVVFFGITCGLSAPYVAGQLSATMQDPDFYTSVLIGFNYPEMARNVAIEGWNRTCHAVFNQLARQSRAACPSHFLLNPIIGPEAITGSSRMKGGSMTKMLLDTVCSCALKRSGVLGARASLVPRPSANVSSACTSIGCPIWSKTKGPPWMLCA